MREGGKEVWSEGMKAGRYEGERGRKREGREERREV